MFSEKIAGMGKADGINILAADFVAGKCLASQTLSTELEKPCRLRTESGLDEHVGRNENGTGPECVKEMLA